MAKTILEEVLEKYPYLTEEELVEDSCISKYRYKIPAECTLIGYTCKDCWNREVKDD